MKENQVPQDSENLNEGKLAKLYYATDENGHYVKVNSVGWEPETIAMRQAWEIVEDGVEEAREKVINGKASPILYYMKKNIMTIPMVASYVGTLGWRVRLDMLPFFFNRVSKKRMERYAFTFRITVDELKNPEKLMPSNER
jgi:hypothetical protein